MDASFPRSAQAFVEAIKKNRTCQKLIREKLAQISARIEENKKLTERVKMLKDFQTACRQRTGRALSQKKDARVQLISIPKQRANASKVKDKIIHAIYQGPAENSHVAHYRNAVSKYPFSLSREPWLEKEKRNLLKGIRQQFQEMLTRNLLSGGDGDLCYRVNMIESIKDHKITCEELKPFLDKVDWKRLASIYVPGRSAPECESRWRNCEDPSINHGPWSIIEDKRLLHIVSNRGISNWIKIAMQLKTNRTPFQCLARFQRSLNASIIKNEWTPPDDEELRKAVAEYGETNWQLVASTLEGRTGTQCSNRWKKSLNPLRERVGKWDPYEDKRLKIAVRLFGAKNWNKIAKFVPGRTQVQCRERWVNCLDPCLNMNEWTRDEDLKLIKAIEEHNYCWSRIAASVPPRTDSQCRRRWKMLFPDQVFELQEARKLKKSAFISNFVDREGERPDLTVKDFITPRSIELNSKAVEDRKSSNKKNHSAVFKKKSTRARKVTRSKKVFKPTNEDDVAENALVDITINGVEPTAIDVDTSEAKKQATVKRKGNQRSVPKIRSRRARQVTHTEKALTLLDEDDVEYNDYHAVGKSRPLDVDNDNEIDRKVERKVTGKRKMNQREKEEEVVGGNSKRTKQIDCALGDETVGICSSEKEFKVYFRRRRRKHNSESCINSNCKQSEEELEDEETLDSFLMRLKKKKNE
ncbi:hypothetical protein QVD17_11510 [Tagetes erecta]|uniref:Uncharacterized protein n=1 Tax=Tagetes erecta TaxID=13708 RepID=A0AAD8P241_TARER|nr:hypothetical protein QVD17_11510 [Tagetes erecta]